MRLTVSLIAIGIATTVGPAAFARRDLTLTVSLSGPFPLTWKVWPWMCIGCHILVVFTQVTRSRCRCGTRTRRG